ncbi:helix-turn-helix domain-containing protein [Flavobacterium tructae]|uniref:helix-turn-helix domain-containing protein n=1 Tax=Flavobacterium tructae TaxID=1114873 RepID=UPI0035A960F3
MVSKSKYNDIGLQVCIFKRFTSKDNFDEQFRVDQFSVLLVNLGFVCLQINNRKVHLYANELTVIPKRALCKTLVMSDYLQICQLSFTSDFAFENSIKWPHIKYFEFFIIQISSKILLKRKDVILMIDLFSLINKKVISNRVHVYKNEIILFSFNLLLYELAGIYHRSSLHLSVRYSKKEVLVMEFFKILELNSKKQHRVRFYAATLYITSGHLTKIVKEITQKTAKQCINQAIVLEAKILLQNNQLTILYIMEELEFTSLSSFCIFFKRHTSLSPSEYRAQLNFH